MPIFSLWKRECVKRRQLRRVRRRRQRAQLPAGIPISTSVYYRYRVWRLDADAGGQWWGAWIQNTASGVDTYLVRCG